MQLLTTKVLITRKYFEKIKDVEADGGGRPELTRDIVDFVRNWILIHEQQGGIEVDAYKGILATNVYDQSAVKCYPQIIVDEAFLAYLEQCEYEPTGVDEISLTPFTEDDFNG